MGRIYAEVGKPSPAKFRRRLEVIRDASHSGAEMARRWNPKGRNYEARRKLVEFFKDSDEIATMFLEHFERQRRR